MSDDPWQAQLEALGAFIRAQRVLAGRSLRDLAASTGVSNAYLSEIERGLHEPSVSVLRAVAQALDVPLEVLLGHAGLIGSPVPLEPAPAGRLDTEAAIERDPALTEPQRIALLSVYRSFVPASARR